jgi:hypothetical protein
VAEQRACIQLTRLLPASQDVGDRIQCNIGEWAGGTVIKTWYRENEWPEGKWAAYQVKLDMGQYIYAPIDQDKVCRAPPEDDAGPPPPELAAEPAPSKPMTWEEIKEWDTCVHQPRFAVHPLSLVFPQPREEQMRAADWICLREHLH